MPIPRRTLSPAALRAHLARAPAPLILHDLPRQWGWTVRDIPALAGLITEDVRVLVDGKEGYLPFSRFIAAPRGFVADTSLLDRCSPLSRALPEGAHLRSGAGEVRARMLLVGAGAGGLEGRDAWHGLHTQLVGASAFRLQREDELELEAEIAAGESLLVPAGWGYAVRAGAGPARALGVGVYAWFR